MYKLSTAQWRLATVLLSTFVAGRALGQACAPRLLRRPTGGTSATLPWNWGWRDRRRVRYSGFGSERAERCSRRRNRAAYYQTSDLENWQRTTAGAPPLVVNANVQSLPEAGAQTRALAGDNEPGVCIRKLCVSLRRRGRALGKRDGLPGRVADRRRGRIWRSRPATTMKSSRRARRACFVLSTEGCRGAG